MGDQFDALNPLAYGGLDPVGHVVGPADRPVVGDTQVDRSEALMPRKPGTQVGVADLFAGKTVQHSAEALSVSLRRGSLDP